MLTRLFWVMAGVLEFPFILALAGEADFLLTRLPWAMGMHALAAGLVLCVSRRRAWLRDLSGVFLFLPVFGWVLIGLVLFRKRGELPRHDFDLETVDVTLPAQKVPPPVTRRGGRTERVFQELDFLSLADIMAGEDFDLKRGGIWRLAQLRTPPAIAFLLKYRRDPSMDVRFLVTTALGKIKRDFEEEIEAARREFAKNGSRLEQRLPLVRLALQYARSGLLEEETAKTVLYEALRLIESSVLDPHAPEAVFDALLDIHAALSEWEKVLEVVETMAHRGLGRPEKLHFWRGRAYYRLRRWREVRQAFGDISDRDLLPRDIRPLVDWWCG